MVECIYEFNWIGLPISNIGLELYYYYYVSTIGKKSTFLFKINNNLYDGVFRHERTITFPCLVLNFGINYGTDKKKYSSPNDNKKIYKKKFLDFLFKIYSETSVKNLIIVKMRFQFTQS
jgi:hypothetical protein